ncbi:MAG: hypothetical protein P8Y20_05295 [Gammaproteobacteria bacterium]|jgi:hypothetical protein
MFSDIPSYQVEEVQLNQQDWENIKNEYQASENNSNHSEAALTEN